MAELLSIEVTGAEELRAELQRAVAQLQRPRELMDALGARFELNIERRFDAERDPSGVPWKRLAPSTVKIYQKKYDGKIPGSLLNRGSTPSMRGSLTHNAGDDYVEIGMSRLTDGGRWSIPLLHETGTRRMPRRGIFLADWQAGTLGAEDEADLREEIAAFLDDVFGG
ncbi:MAG TPA: phage virion morphogenesis protein [Ottowia sp.]|nr:phage virion morphogenesis protein [Ottowia sp.]